MTGLETLLLEYDVPAGSSRTICSMPIPRRFWTQWFGMTWEPKARSLLGYRWFIGNLADPITSVKPSGSEIFPGLQAPAEWFGQGQTIAVPHILEISDVPMMIKLLATNRTNIQLKAQGFVIVVVS